MMKSQSVSRDHWQNWTDLQPQAMPVIVKIVESITLGLMVVVFYLLFITLV